MDRPRADLIEELRLAERMPFEFALFTYRLPSFTERQHHAVIARMAKHCMRLSSGCLVWTRAHNNNGYGRMNVRINGYHTSCYVHRLALRMAIGRELHHWEESSHTCNTPPCFNPAHLIAERRPDNRKRSAENTNRKLAARAAREREAAFACALRGGVSGDLARGIHLDGRHAAR
jgi:hypothetical protein